MKSPRKVWRMSANGWSIRNVACKFYFAFAMNCRSGSRPNAAHEKHKQHMRRVISQLVSRGKLILRLAQKIQLLRTRAEAHWFTPLEASVPNGRAEFCFRFAFAAQSGGAWHSIRLKIINR